MNSTDRRDVTTRRAEQRSRATSRSWSVRLRLWLAAGLVMPVALVGVTSGNPAAAVSNGPVKAFQHDWTIPHLGGDHCKGSAWWEVPDGATQDQSGRWVYPAFPKLRMKGVCWSTGAATVPALSDWGSGSTLSLTFKGTEQGGSASCSLGQVTPLGPSDQPKYSMDATQTSLLGSGFKSCVITTVCYVVHRDQPGPDGGEHSNCDAFSLGAPPLPSSALPGCQWGKPSMKNVAAGSSFMPELKIVNPDTVAHTWYINWSQISDPSAIRPPNTGDASLTVAAGATGYYYFDGQFSTSGPFPGPLLGVQIYPHESPLGLNGRNPSSRVTPSSYPPKDQGFRGITDTDLCRFWIGSKILNIPGDSDEPYSSIQGGTTGDPVVDDTVPPDDENSSCGFSWTDPSTWASAGSCAIIGVLMKALDVLGSIWSAILDAVGWLSQIAGAIGSLAASIAGAIINALGDFFKWAFVPRSSAMQSAVGDMQSSWGNTSIGQWSTAVGQLVPTSSGSSSCDGPHLNVELHAGIRIDSYPLSTCAGWGATLAPIARLITTVGLVLFGGLAVVRGIGSGFGWSPAIGNGGAS